MNSPTTSISVAKIGPAACAGSIPIFFSRIGMVEPKKTEKNIIINSERLTVADPSKFSLPI